MKTFAVAEFYKSGKVFPVEIAIPTDARAQQLRHWMTVGAGQVEDWRVVPMAELLALHQAGRVDLSCFTPAAQAERVKIIEAEGAK